MIKKPWFQLHWLLGMTAGVVLAVVGVTGAMMSFENDLLRWLNPGVMTVAPRAEAVQAALGPAELLEHAQAAMPGRRVISVALSSAPADAAQVRFAPRAGGRRGELYYADPYTGDMLGQARGARFFLQVMQIHRWLAADAIGKQIVGFSTVSLIVLSLSGLYLRWPRRASDWRAWFAVHFARKGRGFLWELHSVAGTVALVFYLLAGFTGLYWSYDWYRNALFAVAGAARPANQDSPARRGPGQAGAQAGSAASSRTALAVAWQTFQRDVPAYATANFRVPERAGQPVQVTYLAPHPAHERAFDRMVIDGWTGAVTSSETYAGKTAGGKFMSSIFALHSGSFFGLPGLVLMMLASLAMPMFDAVEVDKGDPGAVRRWHQRVAEWFSIRHTREEAGPDFMSWRLAERRLLNPGSQGDPVYHLAFEPAFAAIGLRNTPQAWQAGDLADIRVGHPSSDVVRTYSIAADDAYYGDEIRAWHDAGQIERLDLVFSRDQAERMYVQHRLRDNALAVRGWVAQGAAIYVCGSLDGMAPGVDAVLSEILGADALARLAAERRYCRDVY